MRIIARGWSRDQGEKEIVNVSLGEAVDPPDTGDYYSLGQAYLQIENPYSRKLAKAKVAAGTEELRMGGRYLFRVELSREKLPSCSMPLTTAISFTRSGRCSKTKKDKKTKKSNDKKPSVAQLSSRVIGDWRLKRKGENCWSSSEKSLPR